VLAGAGPRSNSFNFVPVRDVARASGAPCPVRTSPESSDPARSIYLRISGHMRLFETTTKDFSDEEVLAIKARGQLYADVSSKLAPDDFEMDLRKLASAAECADCAKRSRCGACWLPVRENVFERDRRSLEGVLATLAGSVLDVGCGDGPYLRVIAERVARGEASYTGIDPDAARLAVLRSRYPWARYFEGDVKAFHRASGGRRFDHVLFLRSYNHLPDPEGALEVAVSLLVDGGSLLVADNVAFGLVRDGGHAARAERGVAAFEHFRNDAAADAVRRIERPGLVRTLVREVDATTSNEWLVRYRKEMRVE
jgi:SAM-dependent methyltransferase